MSKRPASSFALLLAKQAKTAKQTVADRQVRPKQASQHNACLTRPVRIVNAIFEFLRQARQKATDLRHGELEIEARLGILEPTFGEPRRVTSTGPKEHNGRPVEAYVCSLCGMSPGVSRTHFVTWTEGGNVRYGRHHHLCAQCQCLTILRLLLFHTGNTERSRSSLSIAQLGCRRPQR